ncbi:T9SS type A sorting domain-containing protein [candidate division KSB1 bacterium]|nr:T9SS type A sorting domain-containing protein [candidate division KSB1 bacterium]
MYKRLTSCVALGISLLLLSFSTVFAQGDNTPDPLVNLGCLESATLTGSVPDGRGIPSDILWDPATGDFMTPSSWHEYGLGYDSTAGGVTKDNPMYWQVEWPTAKNINYITCTGPFGNQPQPHTGWAVQIWVDDDWQDLAKADNGWDADTLRGISGWVSDGLLHWRGIEPVVTTKLRFLAYANPDSLADGVDTFADSLWSMVFVGRQMSASSPKACLIQYLDFTGEEADNDKDEMVNLGLVHEVVVSVPFNNGEISNSRGQPSDLLYDPVKGDFHDIGTPWGEIGYPYNYDAGYVEEDAPFYWMCEWPVPKNVNYFTWEGCYGNQPQPNTPWAVQYWDGAAWVELASGVGSDRFGPPLLDSNGKSYNHPGIGVDSTTSSTWQSDEPIQTTKFRLAVWSDGIDPLFSFHFRGRGGQTQNWDEREYERYYEPETGEQVLLGADPIPSTFKAILVQYKDLETAVESEDLVKPTEFSLDQNYPNPFNPQTNITYSLKSTGRVRLVLYNVQGQEVAVLVDGIKTSGTHQVTFNAKSLNSGVYFYRINTDQGTLSKKMMLMK